MRNPDILLTPPEDRELPPPVPYDEIGDSIDRFVTQPQKVNAMDIYELMKVPGYKWTLDMIEEAVNGTADAMSKASNPEWERTWTTGYKQGMKHALEAVLLLHDGHIKVPNPYAEQAA
jgi:hypothetical protein